MKQNMGMAAVAFGLIMIPSPPAYAYLDPGTGSMLIQAGIAIIAATSLFLSMFWKRVKAFLNRLLGKKEATRDHGNEG
jgi:hypothetical protein